MLRVMDYPLRVRRHVKLSMANLYIARREMYRRGTRATPARPYPAVHELVASIAHLSSQHQSDKSITDSTRDKRGD